MGMCLARVTVIISCENPCSPREQATTEPNNGTRCLDPSSVATTATACSRAKLCTMLIHATSPKAESQDDRDKHAGHMSLKK